MQPGKYFIACELNPLHRVLDLPSQYAHLDSGLVQAITGNGSEYQKWILEKVPDEPAAFTIRSNVVNGRFLEPFRSSHGGEADRSADEILIGFYPRTECSFQHWRLESAGDSTSFYVVNAGSGKYWDLREQDPSHIQQLFRKDTPHQRWRFKPCF